MNKNERALVTAIEDLKLSNDKLEQKLAKLAETLTQIDNALDHEQGRIDELENFLCDLTLDVPTGTAITADKLKKELKARGIIDN